MGIEEIGQAPAGDALRRQTPEDIAEVAVGRERTARAIALRPEVRGKEKVRKIRAVGETLSQPQAERRPGDDSGAMAQEILESGSTAPARRGWKDLAQGQLERQQAGAVQNQRQGRHPRFGQRGGIEAGARPQALAADPVAGGVAEADLLRVGQQHLDRAHRCAQARESVDVGGELLRGRRLRLTVGH